MTPATLKQAKTKLTMKVNKVIPADEAGYKVFCLSVTEHTPKGGVLVAGKTKEYTIRQGAEADQFVMREVSVSGDVNVCNTWDHDCTCDGRRNGYYCRHLKIAARMQKRGDFK